MDRYALLLCAGSGTRMGINHNKTLIKVNNTPSCVRAYKVLKKHVLDVIVIVKEGEEALFKEVFSTCHEDVHHIITGGDSRKASVYKGLLYLKDKGDIVIVHDGARPLIDEKMVVDALQSAEKYGSGVTGIKMRDTVKEVDKNMRVVKTLDREQIYAVQTPQAFQKALLLKAHQQTEEVLTDDAALVERITPVYMVEGNVKNIKLTSQEDVAMANAFFPQSMRIGQGFDAHKLVENRDLILFGVHIPYEKGLLGHSDADVCAHALMDALLGACALKDIGTHFPDTDAQYKGISSMALLKKVHQLIIQKGYQVGNLDVTIVCQKPKLAPFMDQMALNVSNTLSLSVNQISIKASTTEKMGYEGRGEGITAYAVVLLHQMQEKE